MDCRGRPTKNLSCSTTAGSGERISSNVAQGRLNSRTCFLMTPALTNEEAEAVSSSSPSLPSETELPTEKSPIKQSNHSSVQPRAASAKEGEREFLEDRDPKMKLPMNEPKAEGVPPPGGNSAQASGASNNQEPDFSEFLWMEHEEEFDQEVMQELERDELMQFYEDRFIVEQEGQNDPDLSELSLADQQEADELIREFNRVLLLNSNLNPNAPEFIPNPNAAEFVPGQSRRNDNDKTGFSS